jgi:hypothetical protein
MAVMTEVPKKRKFVCRCTEAPMGRKGLEGFYLDEKYFAEWMESDIHGKPYFRVYLNEHYYETCTVNTFHGYFEWDE